MERVSFSNELFSDLREYVERYVLRATNDEYLARRARDVVERALQLTGHLPSIHGVSRGAGYCSFYARLTEFIGARGYISSGLSGKGRNEHKVLALASLELFSKWSQYSGDVNKAVNSVIEGAIHELDSRGLLIFRSKDVEEITKLHKTSCELLLHLCRILPRLCSILEVGIKEFAPIVEQQLFDYEFYLRGSPDLILENEKQKKAIVVEWKTGKETPSEHEEAQVIAYAILEARRLGCRTLKEVENCLLGDVENEFKGVRILPLIVRPGGRELRPHPVLAPIGKRQERLERFKRTLYNVVLEAQHLTFLLTNVKYLLGIEPKDFLVPLLGSPDKRINALTHIPQQLRYRSGKPISRDRYPCVSKKGNRLCSLYNACGFYFGERAYGEKEDYETILWGLRYEVLANRERSLMVYRALQNLFENYRKDEVLDNIRKGLSFTCNLVHSLSRVERDERWHGKLRVIRWTKAMEEETVDKRIDVIDEVEVAGNHLKCRRAVRDYEKSGMLQVVVEGRSVLLVTLDSNDPLLSIKLFGRVDEVNVVNHEKGGVVEYVLSVPSKLLEFQRLLFSRYISLGEKYRRNLLMIEVDVDLTHLDLEALDALQRALKDEERKKELGEVVPILEEIIKDGRRDVTKEDLDVRSLRILLKQLIGGFTHRLQSQG